MPAAVRHVRFDPADRPFLLIWEVTRACALACRHCRAEAQPWRHPDELTRAEAQHLFTELRGFGDPPPLLVLTGGDPLSRPDLFELIADARATGLPVSLTPSVTPLLTADALVRLRDAGCHVVALSLDGELAATHDTFRATPGVFDATLRAWDEARRIGLRVQINTTVTRHNLHELPGVAQMVQQHGALTWSVFLLVPTGRALHDDVMSAADAEDVLNFLYDVGHTISVKATEAHHYRRVALQRAELSARGLDHVSAMGLGATYHRLRVDAARRGLLEPKGTTERDAQHRGIRRPPLEVSAGRGFVFVSHTGEVYPSGFLPLSAGNIRTESLRDLYRDSEVFRAVRDVSRLKGRCGRCEFQAVCGGSRARAYATTGDLLAEEPLCSYEPGSDALGAVS